MAWHISRHLKEGLAWAIDKQLQVISNMLFETVSYTTKKLEMNEAILSLKQYCTG